MKSRTVGVLALLAAGLVILPWLPWPAAAPDPGPVDGGSRAYQEMLKCAAEVESAVAKGRVHQLRSAVTLGYLGQIERTLGSVDRSLLPGDLKELGALNGDPEELDYVCGAVQGEVGALVFGRTSSVVTGLPGVLRGWRFVWDGWRWRLDGVKSGGAGRDAIELSANGDRLLQGLLGD